MSTTLDIIKGDDYKDVDDRSILVTIEDAPDLTGATVVFQVFAIKGTTSLLGPLTATLLTVGADIDQQVYVELTAAQTGSFSPGTYEYKLQATLANADTVTPIAVGKFVVRRRAGQSLA